MAADAPGAAEAGPIVKLLELGEPDYSREFTWPDYSSFGIGPVHIPALIRIATDEGLLRLPDESDPRSWGPVHAWRALGQLQAEAAIAPLLRLLNDIRDNDWIIEELPDVFALIGPSALPALVDYLSCPNYPAYARLVAATSLMEIARLHPGVRTQSVEVLSEQLAGFKQNSAGVNSVLIANLVELQAAEKADLIQKVFTEGQVDRFIVGDWRDIKVLLHPSAAKRVPTTPASLTRNVGSKPPDPANRSVYREPRTSPRNTS